MIRIMHQEHALSEVFMAYLLTRSMRIQADLVDQLFNSSEYDRDYPLSRQSLHESLSQDGLHRIQRSHPGSQIAAKCDPP